MERIGRALQLICCIFFAEMAATSAENALGVFHRKASESRSNSFGLPHFLRRSGSHFGGKCFRRTATIRRLERHAMVATGSRNLKGKTGHATAGRVNEPPPVVHRRANLPAAREGTPRARSGSRPVAKKLNSLWDNGLSAVRLTRDKPPVRRLRGHGRQGPSDGVARSSAEQRSNHRSARSDCPFRTNAVRKRTS